MAGSHESIMPVSRTAIPAMKSIYSRTLDEVGLEPFLVKCSAVVDSSHTLISLELHIRSAKSGASTEDQD